MFMLCELSGNRSEIVFSCLLKKTGTVFIQLVVLNETNSVLIIIFFRSSRFMYFNFVLRLISGPRLKFVQ